MSRMTCQSLGQQNAGDVSVLVHDRCWVAGWAGMPATSVTPGVSCHMLCG